MKMTTGETLIDAVPDQQLVTAGAPLSFVSTAEG